MMVRTQTAAQVGVNVSAAAMLATSAVALFSTWGMLSLLAVSAVQPQFKMAVIPSGGEACQLTEPFKHGKRRVAGIIVKSQFGDTGWTRAVASSAIFGEVNEFFQKNSYYREDLPPEINGIKFVGEGGSQGGVKDIYPASGAYEITIPTTCDYSGTIKEEPCSPEDTAACEGGRGKCNVKYTFSDFLSAVMKKADPDIRYEPDMEIVLFMKCAKSANQAYCANTAGSVENVQTNEGVFNFHLAQIKNPPLPAGQQWSIAHEIAHNFGSADNGYYGFDIMGIGYYHSYASNKENSEWLQECSTAIHNIKTITESGEYFIQPIELQDPNPQYPQALKIPHGRNESGNLNYLYLEWRQPIDLDAKIPSSGTPTDVFSGATLHTAWPADFFDADVAGDEPLGSRYFSALPPGKSYTDPNSGTTVTVKNPLPPSTENPSGLLPITVDVKRTDFTGPTVYPLQLVKQLDSCEMIYEAKAEDPSGIAKIEFYLRGINDQLRLMKTFEGSPTEITLSPLDDGYLYFIAYDKAQDLQGGLAENNTSQSEQLRLSFQCNRLPVVTITSDQLSVVFSTEEAAPDGELVQSEKDGSISIYKYFSLQFPQPIRDNLKMKIAVDDDALFIFNFYDNNAPTYQCSGDQCLFDSQIFVKPVSEYILDFNEPLIPGEHWLTFTIHDQNFNMVLINIYVEILPTLFKRGDVNQDRVLDISDAITILDYRFLGNIKELSCLDAADANDDGLVDISDALSIITYLFLDSAQGIPPPSNQCGVDPTPNDDLSCAQYLPCGGG